MRTMNKDSNHLTNEKTDMIQLLINNQETEILIDVTEGVIETDEIFQKLHKHGHISGLLYQKLKQIYQ